MIGWAACVAVAASGAAPPVVTVASVRGERRVPVSEERGHPALAAVELGAVLTLAVLPAPPGAASLDVLGRQVDFVLDAGYFRFEGRVYTLAAGPYVARDTLFVPLQWVVEYLPRLFEGRFRFDAARARLEELPPAPPRPVARADAASPPPATVAPPVAASVGPAPRARRRRVVAVDPGHGGPDVGMLGPIGRRPFLREKDVTLAVARLLAEELERLGLGVVMTRTRDTLIAVGDRGRIAGTRQADIFVSIHVNAANPRWRNAETARGFETYFLAEAKTEDARRVARMENASVSFETAAQVERGDPLGFILSDLAQNEHLRESSRLAELVQAEMGRVHPAESRGVKQAGLLVLATTYMPAVLVEIGFGSNDAEARYLTGTAGQRRLARAVAGGVERYLAEYERRVETSP